MPSRRRSVWLTPPVQVISFRYLLVVPILLAVATSIALFVCSDVDVALLWSQCHSRARIPALSRIPALGTPACFLISFFQCALDSRRTKAVAAVVLAHRGALATVSAVEAARACNRPNALIARPTGPWLASTLLGGAVVWQLVIVPAFMHRARTLFLASRRAAGRNADEDEDQDQDADEDEDVDIPPPTERDLALAHETGRTLPDSEVVAIPIAIAVGYFLPAVLMLVYNTPAAISVWFFFPVYISVARQAVRYVIEQVRRSSPASIHLEARWQCVVLVYALPILLSVLAHIFVLWSMTAADDRRKMTRLAVKFIEIDGQFFAWTVLYWVFVEVGWRAPLAIICTSVVVGPGGGTCLGWIYREKLAKHGFGEKVDESPSLLGENRQDDEETPLLR